MARMYRVLGFWALVIGLMAWAGGLQNMAYLFMAQTVVFVFLGYMNLSERSYIILFWCYMMICFSGFSYWSIFVM